MTSYADTKDLTWGRKIHMYMIKIGVEVDDYLGTGFAIMYIKNGRTEDACQILGKNP